MKRFIFKFQSGQSLVEVLLALALASLFLPALLTGLVASRDGRAQNDHRTRAIGFLKEAEEAVRNIRNEKWDLIATNGIYHPALSGSTWTLAANTETIDASIGLTRQIIISDVYRNNFTNIISTTPTPPADAIDPSTKKVVMTVSWTKPTPDSVESTMYFTRYRDNIVYKETTKAQFDNGTTNGVAVTQSGDGEIILGAGGHGDWCKPQDYILDEVDLDGAGAATSIQSVVLDTTLDVAFTGTNKGSSGIFQTIVITNTDPPDAFKLPTSLPEYSTNDIHIDGHYAYVATSNDTKEVVIIDLNDHVQKGTLNLPGTDDAIGIYAIDDIGIGYVTAGSKLYRFTITNKSSPQLKDSIDLGTNAKGYQISVVSGYAYIAVESNNAQLQLVNVTNPTNNTMQLVGSTNVGGARGQDVFVNPSGTRVYLATTSSALPEFYIINSTTKTGSLPIIGSYDSSGMSPNGVIVVSGNKAILVGGGGSSPEYQVIDITNEANPISCGGLDISHTVYGVTALIENDNDVYSYIVTADPDAEFKVIQGGPGGSYSQDGEFTSQIYDVKNTAPLYSNQAAFNRYTMNFVKPPNTTFRLQFAIADPVSASCSAATYTFNGPSGPASYYENPTGTIRLDNDNSDYENPARCLKYKLFLSTTDYTQSPVFYDISINHSP
jgi:type II secretory pathway pseudopilin PulG